jgi:ABC-type nitrate/sulfonate/bicarbonate transport system substrate-binding protein
MTPALNNRSVDIVLHNEPFMATTLEQGIAVKFRSVDEFYPYMQFSVILYGPHFARDNPDAARRWMVAYLRGLRDAPPDALLVKLADRVSNVQHLENFAHVDKRGRYYRETVEHILPLADRHDWFRDWFAAWREEKKGLAAST